MADIDLYTLTLQNDANLYKFRDDRADELVAADIDIEDHTLMLDGEDIAGLNGKVDKSSVGVANGVASLDQNGQVPTSQLPDELDISTETITGNPISFNTLTAQNAESTEVGIESIQDLHGYTKPWVGGAGKNLLPLTITGIKEVNTDGTWSGNTYSLNNVTFTILTDSDNNVIGIKADSNNSSAVTSLYLGKNITLTDGTYILNGSPSGGGDSNYEIVADGKSVDTGSGTNITVSGDTFNLRARIASSYTGSNIIFYPMIRLSTVSDATFEPYTNICSIFPGVYSKNLLVTTVENLKTYNTTGTWSGNTYTLNNCVYTIVTNDDGKVSGIKVKTSGTVSENTHLVFATVQNPLTYLNKNTYFISGLASGTTSNIKIISYCSKSTTGYWYDSVIGDSGLEVTVGENNRPIYFGIRVYSNASISTDVLVTPMIEIGSSKTDFEPYDTHKIKILGTGKNLFNSDVFAGADGWSKDGNGVYSGPCSSFSSYMGANPSLFYINFKELTQYTLSLQAKAGSESKSPRFIIYYTDGTSTRTDYINSTSWATYKVTTNGSKSVDHIGFGYSSSTTLYIKDFQIEEGNITTPVYEPYNLNTNIAFETGQNVYNGSLNAETGTVTVDMGYVDLGDLDWTYNATNHVFWGTDTTLISNANANTTPICSCYEGKTPANALNTAYAKGNGTTCFRYPEFDRLFIRDDSYTDATLFTTAVTGQKLVYKLATPFTIQLTPQQIALLKGYNYLSTNCQSLDLTYRIGEMATLGDVKDAIEDSNRNNLGTGVDISSYTNNDNKFHVPCDGYIQLGSESLTSGSIRVIIYGADNDNSKRLYEYMNITGTYQMSTTFVRKGMYCKVQSIATGAIVAFIPLI